MSDNTVAFVILFCVAVASFSVAVGFSLGETACLTESCQASCAESGYDASTLEDDECVCIQYSVMEK